VQSQQQVGRARTVSSSDAERIENEMHSVREVELAYASSNEEEEEEAELGNSARARGRSASFPSAGGAAVDQDDTRMTEVLPGSLVTGSGSGKVQSYWCLVKAKTRQHNSTKVSRRVVWFEAKQGSTFSVGRTQGCDLRLDDDRCASLNAVLEPVFTENSMGIMLNPKARMYQLVGMGTKKNVNDSIVSIGSVIKIGSVSLEVTDMCTSEGDDFVERFAVEISTSPNRAQVASNDSKVLSSEEGNNEAESEGSMENTVEETPSDDARTDVNGEQSTQEEDADAICYICWGGACTSPKSHPENEETKPRVNPLIRNPCGKCSGSSRFVHLDCLLTWIKSSGSGHCSICNGALPQHFSSPPPNIELKVVRHRRGQSWVGTRRFRLSFTEREYAVIGRDSDADVRLSDRSVGSIHARITFNRETRQFEVSDCASLGGTFLQVRDPMQLVPETATYLKIGRTLLSLRMTQRRGILLNMIQNPLASWTKR